jgi:hypothetical protein
MDDEGEMSEQPIRAIIVQTYQPEVSPRRVLLFNPPVYDTRFPWINWQQPVALLQLGTLLRLYESDVRLIDALYLKSDEKITRRRVRILTRGGISINYWRYGHFRSELISQLRALKRENWEPDDVYIQGFTTTWWEGAAEATDLIRQIFPQSQIILFGAYPWLAIKHALDHSKADILARSIKGTNGLSLDLSSYSPRPSFTYLSIGTDSRSSDDIIKELTSKANPVNQQKRIGRFAFADHDVIRRYPQQFRNVLKTIIDQKLKVSFYALGNIYPRDLVEDPELAMLLFQAGFKQLVFADDRELPLTEEAREQWLANYRQAIAYCVQVGYKWRTEDLVGSVCIGRPGENLAETAGFMAEVAHEAGSLIVIPYQPKPEELEHVQPDIPLEYQNGKLFPFAEYNGVSFRDYQELLGLAAVLNAKYRSRTFDFLGDGLISRLVRASFVSESWDPHKTPEMQNERPVIMGWFNKEGKWVKS